MLSVGMPLPGSDNRNTTKLSARYGVTSFVGRIMLFHAKSARLGEVVVVKAVTEPLMSEVPKRNASRSPSRPNALPVVAPVVRVKLNEGLIVDAVEKVATDAAGTLPLCETVAAPKPTLPLTVIRTGGRRYAGVSVVPLKLLSVRSQLSRKGSHKFGTRNQLRPPVVPVPATGQAASELR